MNGLSLSPLHRLLGIVGIAVAILLFQTNVFLSTPWLGIDLVPSPDGHALVVQAVHRESPNFGQVKIGDRIEKLTSDKAEISITAQTLIEEPDTLDERIRYQAFLTEQGTIYSALGHPPVRVVINGKVTELHSGIRPLTALPGLYVAQQIFGLLGLLIGAGVWVYNSRSYAARLLFISGIGFYLSCIAAAFYSTRELAIDETTFYILSSTNHLGAQLFAAAFVLLFWHYPKSITTLRIDRFVFAFFAAVWLVDTFQLSDSVTTAVYVPVLLAFTTGIIFGVVQWRRSRNQPAERAALKWFLLSLYLGAGMFVVLAAIPIMFGVAPPAEQSVALGTFLIMYTGLALGVARYRLFDMDRWWLRTWVWFFAGLAIIGLDLAVVSYLEVNRVVSLSLVLLVLGWLYFPLRQFIWQRLSPELDTDALLHDPQFVSALLAVKSDKGLATTWEELLQRLFVPLTMIQIDTSIPATRIDNSGEDLDIPHVRENQHLRLRFRSQGRKLFSSRDREFCDQMYRLFRLASASINSREEGALIERQRIGRDLHDDLGAKLLRLVHSANDEQHKTLAQEAMIELRETLSNIEQRETTLPAALARMRSELETRLGTAGVKLNWQADPGSEIRTLPARVTTNLQRIVRELTTNALKHAQPRAITISIDRIEGALKLVFTHDGLTPDTNPQLWEEGRGLTGMGVRLAEIGGQMRQSSEKSGELEVALEVPLPADAVAATGARAETL